jgi:biopolymer transport protein ExbD
MKPLAQINVIPFIDIMLVLLAVVLTSATFIAQGRIPVSLPQASQGEAVSGDQVLQLTVDADGRVYLDDKAVSLDTLAAALTGMGASTPVRLRVDAQAAFRHFVAVIDLLKARNMTNVAILTRRTG